MRTLQWVSDNGQYVFFGEEEPIILTSPLAVNNDAAAQIFKAPNQDGATTYGAYLNQPTITFDFVIIARGNKKLKARTILDEYRNLIAAALSPKLQGWLIYNNERGGNVIRARPISTPVITATGESSLSYAVEMISDSPLWQDITLNSVKIGELNRTHSFPFRFPMAFGSYSQYSVVRNRSRERVHPIFEIYSPLSELVIINETTGERMNINRRIEANQTMRIDTAEKTVTLYQDGEIVGDVSNWMDGDFVSLACGENQITVENDVPGDVPAVVMFYRNNIMGV